MNASLISEALLLAVGVGTGLMIGVTVNLRGRSIPLAMEVEWRRHIVERCFSPI